MQTVDTTSDQALQLLEADLNSGWSIGEHPHYPGSWYIRNPFHYDDGDGVNVCVERDADGWVLTDHGFTVFHMFVDEFEGYYFRGVDRIEPVIAGSGLEVREPGLELIMRIRPDDVLSPSHVGRFIMALERVRGAALVHERGYHDSCDCCEIRYEDSPEEDPETGTR